MAVATCPGAASHRGHGQADDAQAPRYGLDAHARHLLAAVDAARGPPMLPLLCALVPFTLSIFPRCWRNIESHYYYSYSYGDALATMS